jgi:hypothetical protein
MYWAHVTPSHVTCVAKNSDFGHGLKRVQTGGGGGGHRAGVLGGIAA